ncbi:MAG: response regulator [Candidatus Moranbacteria bacterium]|nr:response regulator [Candidatus Moranbacteria bacterium]
MKIIIIEDQEDFASYIKKGLTEKGYVIDWEPNGEKAFWKVRFSRYDMILLDIRIPEKNGLEILSDLRKMQNHVPIIIFSAEKELDIKLKSFNLGVDDYITKPFSIDELSARIQAILKRGKKIKNNLINISSFAIDNANFKVTKKGREIKLRRKEFDLFCYFAQNPHTVITRSQILEKVWDMNADPFTNTVDVHIKSLRKKLGDTKGRFIKTIYGRGYQLVEKNI